MKPAYSDDWATVYLVDALTGLQQLPEKSVHCAITSPPYWGLRSYLASDHPDKAMELGAEPTPELYVERLVEVFRALRRVLRDDGQLWLNLGSSYASSGIGDPDSFKKMGARLAAKGHRWSATGNGGQGRAPTTPGFKPKDLVPIPWMVAMALQRDAWYLRSDIIWQKPNPMPSSVTDRPTCSHEYMFLLTKSPRYFFDQDAVREKHATPLHAPGNKISKTMTDGPMDRNGNSQWDRDMKQVWGNPAGRNIRSVWNIATQPYPGAHYATFPPALIYPCIKAGTSERGVCEACGAPWERVVERERTFESGSGRSGNMPVGKNGANLQGGGETLDIRRGPCVQSHTVGWQPICSCNTATIPATVLDPFMGSGTTALAARKLGRRSIGFDLDERNVRQIEERLGYQGVLL